MFSPSLDSCYVVALDVGGSSVKSGSFAPAGGLLAASRKTPLDSQGSAELILSTLAGVVVAELAQIPEGARWRLALGFPGPFDYARGVSLILGVCKYEAIYGVDVGAEMKARIPRQPERLLFINDAAAAIMGEAVKGAGQGVERVIGITLGTGFGSAFFAGGVHQLAGPGIPGGGELYPCAFGDLRADDTFSTRGLQARAAAAGFPDDEGAALVKRAEAGDAPAARVWADFGRDMGLFLTPYAQAFGAGSILVLGGLSSAWHLFAPAMQESLGANISARIGQLGAEAPLEGLRHAVFAGLSG